MVRKNYGQPKYSEPSEIMDPSLSDEQKEKIMKAQPHITKEFYAFIWIMKAQYELLFSKLYAPESTQKEVISITQGYDYAIPDNRIGFSLRYPLQPLLNYFMGNGVWLYRPLMIRGIHDKVLQKALVFTFIYEFNRMFISLAQDIRFKNVYHIDCRGLAKPEDWHDELHYKSNVFKKVARAYEYIIDNHGNSIPKVIRAADITHA